LTILKTIGHIRGVPQRSVRNQLVEQAEDVFRRRGFHGASVQDITTAAGVPKGSFYNHFESKQALAAEIAGRYARATDLSMLGFEGDHPLKRLRAHFADQVQRVAGTGTEFGCLFGTFAAESPSSGEQVTEAVAAGLETWTSAVAATIEAAQLAGEITAKRPARELATLLIDTFEGAALRVKVTGDATLPMTHIDVLLDALS
jgi:TetR/AcrR family transcriptional regulator, transcriptional repressor for nem operon